MASAQRWTSPPTSEERRAFERHIGLRESISMLIGVVIGSGIFSSPGFVVQYVGSPGAALLVWLGCGFVSLLGGLCYAELGAALPFTGGESVYLERAFGRLSAFLYVWVSALLARPASVGLSAMVCSDYICRLVWPDGVVDSWDRKNIAFGIIGGLALLQLLSTRISAWIISPMTWAKLGLIAALILIGLTDLIFLGNDTGQLSFNNSFTGTTDVPGNWVIAFANCLFSFNGWNSLNGAAAEVRAPSTTIPTAIPAALFVITLSYLFINVSYFISLPKEAIAGSQTVAIDFAEQVVGKMLTKIITAGISMSALATCHSTLFTATLASCNAGRSRILPQIFSWQLHIRASEKPTPAAALVLQAGISLSLVAMLNSFEALIRVYIWIQWLFFALTIAALVSLRWREPNLERPFRVWIIVPVLFIATAVFTVLVLFFISPATSSVAVLVVLLGLPVYLFHTHNLKKAGVVWTAESAGGYDAEAMPLLVEQQSRAAESEDSSSTPRKLL